MQGQQRHQRPHCDSVRLGAPCTTQLAIGLTARHHVIITWGRASVRLAASSSVQRILFGGKYHACRLPRMQGCSGIPHAFHFAKFAKLRFQGLAPAAALLSSAGGLCCCSSQPTGSELGGLRSPRHLPSYDPVVRVCRSTWLVQAHCDATRGCRGWSCH